MKTPIKALVVALLVLIGLSMLAWTGIFLFWHFRILSAIRELETEPPAYSPSPAFKTLRHGAGCRALPYLVQALEPDKSPAFLERATLLIAIEAAEPPIKGDRWSPVINDDEFDWRIGLKDSVEVRARKCGRVREYWRQNGSRHHQAWRIWSRACVPSE